LKQENEVPLPPTIDHPDVQEILGSRCQQAPYDVFSHSLKYPFRSYGSDFSLIPSATAPSTSSKAYIKEEEEV
jgi:hypothetical protein